MLDHTGGQHNARQQANLPAQREPGHRIQSLVREYLLGPLELQHQPSPASGAGKQEHEQCSAGGGGVEEDGREPAQAEAHFPKTATGRTQRHRGEADEEQGIDCPKGAPFKDQCLGASRPVCDVRHWQQATYLTGNQRWHNGPPGSVLGTSLGQVIGIGEICRNSILIRYFIVGYSYYQRASSSFSHTTLTTCFAKPFNKLTGHVELVVGESF